MGWDGYAFGQTVLPAPWVGISPESYHRMKDRPMRTTVLSLLLCLGSIGSAHAECVIELDRSQVDVVNGELRVDLRREILRRCEGLDLSRVRVDQVKVVVNDDRRRRFGGGRDRDRSDRDRYEDRFERREREGRRRRGELVQIFRFFNGRQHMVSDDPNEGPELGYRVQEGPKFSLFTREGRDRVALYACVVPSQNDRFLSRDANCEGQRSEGLLGFAQDRESDAARRPLYRCYYPKNQNHLITTDKNECIANRFAVEPILGYVP